MRSKNYFEAAIVNAICEGFLCPPNHNPIKNEVGESVSPN